MLRYLTSGESHGKRLLGILEGIPSGLQVLEEDINKDLLRRQKGYGRGGRMKIERDEVEIISGIRKGKTIGSPIGLEIENRDWTNWEEIMESKPGNIDKIITHPRPGHADLAGAIKYNQTDIRNILERASARETAMRVAVGSISKIFLAQFNIIVVSHVVEICGVKSEKKNLPVDQISEMAEKSVLMTLDEDAEKEMIKKIDEAKVNGDSLGGIFEIIVRNPPVGLGSYIQWDKRLNARLAYCLMGIQAIKGVEIGLGFEASRRPGSLVHDEIYYDKENGKFFRKTNNAGGLEGGITNGEDIIIRAAMKPIATLYKPLQSVDILSKEKFEAGVERSDISAVPAASVVGEAVVAFEIASAMMEKFGGDSMVETKRNFDGYIKHITPPFRKIN